jgi:NADP-dependent 3-hydroxy acid dehydrogenase YdfG
MSGPAAAFDGKVAVVTGASRGIGKAIALGLANQRATLCLVGRSERTLEEVARAASLVPTPAHVFKADLTDDEHVRSLSRFVEHQFKTVDILVHCAGQYGRGTFHESSVEQFDLLYRANVRAPYLVTQLLLPLLTSHGGQIVFVNSTQGLRAAGGVGLFAATQHALKAFADSLREEVNPYGVRVLNVFPGRTATPRMQSLYEGDGKTYLPELLLQPEDIASAVVNALALPRTAEVTDINIRPAVKSY